MEIRLLRISHIHDIYNNINNRCYNIDNHNNNNDNNNGGNNNFKKV